MQPVSPYPLSSHGAMASCMRVSSTIRDITGPDLYRCVRWNSGSDIQHYPFFSDWSGLSGSHSSDHFITPKSSFFKYIHFFQLDEHCLSRCRTFPKPTTTLQIPVLRIRATVEIDVHARKQIPRFRRRPAKPAVARFEAKKLILDHMQSLNVLSFLPSESFDQSQVKTLVLLVDLRLVRLCGGWGWQRPARYWDQPEASSSKNHGKRIIDKRAIIMIRCPVPRACTFRLNPTSHRLARPILRSGSHRPWASRFRQRDRHRQLHYPDCGRKQDTWTPRSSRSQDLPSLKSRGLLGAREQDFGRILAITPGRQRGTATQTIVGRSAKGQFQIFDTG
jgi:hypothetical protein